ncbi:MAG: hypothetical protein LBB86_01505 [Oscillospiraceae bacterium]|jgi:predicted transcriptional regulator YdeE|nr:hypothetical protein [Oscillospiraceae bacterium]
MMKITNVQKTSYPECRFIGKKYGDEDRACNGTFGSYWGEWFEKGWFAPLEKMGGLAEAGDSYIGLCRCASEFEYWIGMFFPAGTDAPEGYVYIDLPAKDYGVCWLFDKEDSGELYGMDAHKRSVAAVEEHGMSVKPNGYTFELYNCPRFTTPDEHGNVILDYAVEIN